jgi:glyoxylase-like metal-dependent hydrolase (beta-lactamase superfamily II)
VNAVERVAPGVRLIALPLPLALKVVNVYLVEGEHGWALVDSGLHTADAERVLRDGLARAGIAMTDLQRNFVTHLHPDHLGMAGTLRAAGAEVVMHRPELAMAREIWAADHHLIDTTYAWFEKHGMPHDVDLGMRTAWIEMAAGVDPFDPVRTVEDGESVDLGGRAMTVVWTPGHTDHHAVLFEPQTRTLFAGDHVLPRITSNVGLYPYSRDDPLGDFLAALEKMKTLGVKHVLPAHGEPFDDCDGRVDEVIAHHAARLDDTLAAIGAGRDAYAICRTLFPRLRSAHEERFALAETLAHLRYLERRGRVTEVARWPRIWRTAG